MGVVNLLERHAGLAVIHGGNETQALALCLKSLAAVLKVGIELGQMAPELVE